MAEQKHIARTESSRERDEEQDPDRDPAENGREEDVAAYEQELAGYLQDRIKPGLNRGSIPLLARSIAKEIARHEYSNGGPDDAEADDELSDEANGELSSEADDEGETGP